MFHLVVKPNHNFPANASISNRCNNCANRLIMLETVTTRNLHHCVYTNKTLKQSFIIV